MTIKDAKRVFQAAKVLDDMNKKYNYPHGPNPTGIVIKAIQVLSEKGKQSGSKKADR